MTKKSGATHVGIFHDICKTVLTKTKVGWVKPNNNILTPHPNPLPLKVNRSGFNPTKTGIRRGAGGEVKRVAFTLGEVLIALAIIGIIAAVTLPTLIQNYRKRVVEVRLQQTWSMLNNAVNMAKVEHGDIENWDWSLNTQNFVNTYLMNTLKISNKNYINSGCIVQDNKCYTFLSNGVKLEMFLVRSSTAGNSLIMYVDIDGNSGKNQPGIDRFCFHLVPAQRSFYNTGSGDSLYNIPSAGLYYDGYGFDDYRLTHDPWRGCSKDIIEGGNLKTQGFRCTALIAKNNWKIPDDYPKKF